MCQDRPLTSRTRHVLSHPVTIVRQSTKIKIVTVGVIGTAGFDLNIGGDEGVLAGGNRAHYQL